MKGDNRCSYKQSTPHSTGLSMYLGSWLCLFNSVLHSNVPSQYLFPELPSTPSLYRIGYFVALPWSSVKMNCNIVELLLQRVKMTPYVMLLFPCGIKGKYPARHWRNEKNKQETGHRKLENRLIYQLSCSKEQRENISSFLNKIPE